MQKKNTKFWWLHCKSDIKENPLNSILPLIFLVGNVKRATSVSSKLQAPSSKLQAPGSRLQAPSSKLQSICSDQYVFCFLWKNFIFFFWTKFIWGIWGMNRQCSWQILPLVSFIQLIKVRCHFKTEKHRYFAVPNSLNFWTSSTDP